MVHEAQFEAFPTQENRERLQKVQADMIKYLAIEEEFWKQKVGMQWFKEGDRNTKFFPAHVNGRTKKLQIKRIQNNTGAWIEQDEEIAEVAVSFFKNQFTENDSPTRFHILDHIPTLIDADQNVELLMQPNKEEVKKAVLGLNGESAGGPDGFTGCFYQFCWDIIGDDIYDMVRAVFNGHELPKCITHTNLVLLPKKKEVTTFSDLRPISLSNFSNKIISRAIHERLVGFLHNIISDEQA